MVTKKRIRDTDISKTSAQLKKRRGTHNKQHQFETQEIWKNLDRIKRIDENAVTPIPHSRLFITFMESFTVDEVSNCIRELHEYIEESKLQIHQLNKRPDIKCVILKNFNLLDCCLVLTVLMAWKSKKWTLQKADDTYFEIPKNTRLSGNFYLPRVLVFSPVNSVTHYKGSDSITVPEGEIFPHFKECFVDGTGNVTTFMNKIAAFFKSIKFTKKVKLEQQFKLSLCKYWDNVDLAMNDVTLDVNMLFDVTKLNQKNIPLIKESKKKLAEYTTSLLRFNENIPEPVQEKPMAVSQNSSNLTNESTSSQSKGVQQVRKPYVNNGAIVDSRHGYNVVPENASAAAAHSSRPNFMTQEQIRDHCIATIKSSHDKVSSESPYQIQKVYVKCPRQKYTDIVYQNLNDIRTKTSCNVVVLNLNNLHESHTWFNTLDLTKHTNFPQIPHQSTVRVISVGGVGEHILKALNVILDIIAEA